MIIIITTDMARAIADMSTERNSLARRRARGVSLWAALWMTLCLLLAQHAGLTHRVVHGGLLNTPLTVSTAPADQDHHGDQFSLKLGVHSCVLFDGATLADTHFGTPALPVLRFGKPVKPASLAWRWPDLPSRHPFHSRAPPAPLAFA